MYNYVRSIRQGEIKDYVYDRPRLELCDSLDFEFHGLRFFLLLSLLTGYEVHATALHLTDFTACMLCI